MCRFLAYLGKPVFLDEVITKPCHSLIHQSLHASEAKTVTNGDGFGLGWYANRKTPGLYRELRPAWSDENLAALCEQVSSHAFFAHIRAATGTATNRVNCHPFVYDKHMFMHNGQVGCYSKLKRRLEHLIPDDLYQERGGTTDSEIIFLIALANGAERDPFSAMVITLNTVQSMMDECGVCEPFRFAAAWMDGETLHAYRWASDGKAPTLYWKADETGLMVASEPVDKCHENWHLIPQAHCLIAKQGAAPETRAMLIGAAKSNLEKELIGA
jgi:predicted glutamine amidotransferase